MVLTPGTGSPGATIVPMAPASSYHPVLRSRSHCRHLPAGQVALAVSARYGRDAPAIGGGLIWRVYSAKADATGVFRLIKEEHSGRADFCPAARQLRRPCQLRTCRAPPKRYSCAPSRFAKCSIFPPAAFGSRAASATSAFPTGQISFDVYTGSQFDTAERRPDRAERDDRRRRAVARRHLLHRVELRRRQFGGAL